MREELLDVLAEPVTGADLILEAEEHDGGNITRGSLISTTSGKRYPIVRGIPRFADVNNYTASFGEQWNAFRETQLDSVTQQPASLNRFRGETGWRDEDLRDKWVLDAGCGAGRFAEVAARSGARFVGLDYSSAIDAAAQTLQRFPNAHLVQGSVLEPPFKQSAFDFAYCIGVVQHTPDPERAVEQVVRCTKHGGHFAMTIYARRPWTKLHAKYLVRPLAKSMSRPLLRKLVEASMPVVFPVTDRLFRLPVLGRVARFTIPVANYVDRDDLTREQRYEESVLDTIDMLSPVYDNPMTSGEVESVLRRSTAQAWRFNTHVPVNVVGTR